MGLLDDAIREHLELKRKHGADLAAVARAEKEALGAGSDAEAAPPVEEPAAPYGFEPEPVEPAAPPPPAPEPEPVEPAAPAPPAPEPQPAPEPVLDQPTVEHPVATPTEEHILPPPVHDDSPWLDDEPDEVPADEALERRRDPAPTGEEDVLEETPDFLQETPEHDRLWFEQKPPRDFDWDK